MTGPTRKAAAAVSVLALLLAGCAVRPRPEPQKLSAEKAVRLIAGKTENIRDFTGSASVTVDADESGVDTFNLSIRYLSPDRYRLMVKGFAGLPLAVITMQADSMSAYFPQDNSYLTSGSAETVISALIPGLNIDIARLTSFLTGILPENELRDFKKTVSLQGDTAILKLVKDPFEHVLLLKGEYYDPVEEYYMFAGERSWRRTAGGFRDFGDGIRFPRTISMERDGGKITFDFSKREFNTGIQPDDVVFRIPMNAEKVRLPGVE